MTDRDRAEQALRAAGFERIDLTFWRKGTTEVWLDDLMQNARITADYTDLPALLAPHSPAGERTYTAAEVRAAFTDWLRAVHRELKGAVRFDLESAWDDLLRLLEDGGKGTTDG